MHTFVSELTFYLRFIWNDIFFLIHCWFDLLPTQQPNSCPHSPCQKFDFSLLLPEFHSQTQGYKCGIWKTSTGKVWNRCKIKTLKQGKLLIQFARTYTSLTWIFFQKKDYLKKSNYNLETLQKVLCGPRNYTPSDWICKLFCYTICLNIKVIKGYNIL